MYYFDIMMINGEALWCISYMLVMPTLCKLSSLVVAKLILGRSAKTEGRSVSIFIRQKIIVFTLAYRLNGFHSN